MHLHLNTALSVNSQYVNYTFVFRTKDYAVTQNKKDKRKKEVRGLCQRISLWRYGACKGEEIRQICHLSTEDLKEVDKRNQMRDGRPNCFIANKFDINVDPGWCDDSCEFSKYDK